MSIPAFDVAERNLVAFLEQQGYPPIVAWVFREDVQSAESTIRVRWPIPSANEVIARGLYESGRTRGLGVELRGVCRIDGVTCCYVWIPKDETEAEYALLPEGELKISAPTKLPTGETAGPLSWTWGRASGGTFLEELPRREGL
jgi:hypothetical protein